METFNASGLSESRRKLLAQFAENRNPTLDDSLLLAVGHVNGNIGNEAFPCSIIKNCFS